MAAIERLQITPNFRARTLTLLAPLSRNLPDDALRGRVSDPDGRLVTEGSVRTGLDLAPNAVVRIIDAGVQLVTTWLTRDCTAGEVAVLTVANGAELDRVRSYTALLSLSIDGASFQLNGCRVSQWRVLDQRYWPESFMTTPNDQALIDDIELSMTAAPTAPG